MVKLLLREIYSSIGRETAHDKGVFFCGGGGEGGLRPVKIISLILSRANH